MTTQDKNPETKPDTCPAPCTDITVLNYVPHSDTLVLNFTGSPDIEDDPS